MPAEIRIQTYRTPYPFQIHFLLSVNHPTSKNTWLSLLCVYMINAGTIQCPLCNDPVEKLIYRFHLDGERQVIEKIRQQNPTWSEGDGACSRCVDYYHTELVMQQRILPEIGPYFPVNGQRMILYFANRLRLDADPRFTGKGVTICFIDSGFYPHPDLAAHKNRIRKIVDITNDGPLRKSLPKEF